MLLSSLNDILSILLLAAIQTPVIMANPTKTTLNDILRTPAPILPHQNYPLIQRQDEFQPTPTEESTIVENVETVTVTITPITTVYPDELQVETETVTKSYKLNPATTPIPLSDKMGLIMPNPWGHLYTGLNYSFGFVDPVPRPAPTAGGWLRVVQPLLVFPNYTVAVFPNIGTEDPTSVEAVPLGSDGLCGATAENYAIAWPFIFLEHGWYMFVVNQTYMQVNVTSNNQCTHPILRQQSFFSTQTFSIGPKPTMTPGPAAPSSAYTVFAEVTTKEPGDIPVDPHHASKGEKLAIALGVTGALLGVAVIIAVMWFIRKKRIMEREALAFSRLSQKDQEEFLRENPNSFLNPNHPRYTAKNTYNNNAGPPAPPGTMAYAIWWSQQMWNNQLRQQQNPAWGQYTAPPQMTQAGMRIQQPGWGGGQGMYGGQPMMSQGYAGNGMYQYGR